MTMESKMMEGRSSFLPGGMNDDGSVEVPACRIWVPTESRMAILRDIDEILQTGQVILGKWTLEFERLWAEYVGWKHGVVVSSDTAAMECLFKVWKMKYGWHDGDSVMLPATSFFSCATAVRNAGLNPVVCDASAEAGIFPTLGMFQAAVEAKFVLTETETMGRCWFDPQTGSRLVTFLAVYAAGYVGEDIGEIVEYCRKFKVKVIEDAAHCHGSTLDGAPAGSFGDASCWSFYATKVLNAHEGGMILLDDEDDAEMCRVMRNYGRVSDFGRSLAKYEGYNWRLSEMHCRLGVDQVERADDLMERRRARARWYDEALYALRQLGCYKLAPPDGCEPNYYRYVVMLPNSNSNKENERLREYLKELCAKSGVHLPGEVYEATLNEQPIFNDLGKAGDFPEAERYCSSHICLPINNDGSHLEVQYVARVFQAALVKAKEAGLIR
jgi:perosamine synthetase